MKCSKKLILSYAQLQVLHLMRDTTNLQRKIDRAIRVSKLYKPYLIFLGSFDEANAERLRMAMNEGSMDDVLNLDPRCIKWEDYFMKTHIPEIMNRLA
nr:alcohol-forming fatty acyl-CoA reductase-like [Nicotiana tomentosiformis]